MFMAVNIYFLMRCCAFVLCLISASIYPFIEFISLQKKGSSTITCIGELHQSFYKETDSCGPSETRDKKLLLELISKSSIGKKPLCFIMELRQQDMPKAKNFDPEAGDVKAGCLGTLAAFAAKHDNQFGSIRFIWADNRGPIDRDINEAFMFFSNPTFYQIFCVRFLKHFNAELTHMAEHNTAIPILINELQEIKRADNFDQLLGACPQLKQIYFDKGNLFDSLKKQFTAPITNYTAHDLLNHIDKNIDFVAQLQEKYAQHSQLQAVLGSYKVSLTNIKGKVKNFYQDITPCLNTYCSQAVFDAAQRHSFAYVRDQMYEWLIPLGGITADITFIDHIMQALEQGHNIIFFGGNNHAVELYNICVKIGSTDIFAHGKNYKDDRPGLPIYGSSQFETPSLVNILHKVATHIKENDLTTNMTTSKCALTCAFCNTNGTNYKRCSKCKNVYYCSVECQGRDWPTHKLNCHVHKS